MSYTPTQWKSGDTVTSAKLNKIEQGIADSLSDVDISNPTNGQTLIYNGTSGKWENGFGGAMIVGAELEGETITLDKTWQEIYDAGVSFVRIPIDSDIIVMMVFNIYNDDGYIVRLLNVAGGGSNGIEANVIDLSAESADDYPSTTMG